MRMSEERLSKSIVASYVTFKKNLLRAAHDAEHFNKMIRKLIKFKSKSHSKIADVNAFFWLIKQFENEIMERNALA